jgi:hypothetical protein
MTSKHTVPDLEMREEKGLRRRLSDTSSLHSTRSTPK